MENSKEILNVVLTIVNGSFVFAAATLVSEVKELKRRVNRIEAKVFPIKEGEPKIE